MRKPNALRIFAIALFLVGFAVFCVPWAFQQWNQMRIDQEIATVQPDADRWPELRQAMQEYNQELAKTGQSSMVDQLSYDQPSFLPSAYGVTQETLGVIEIPALGQKLPIYNGASEANMALGAVLLAHTSMPIGGASTNAVIAAHSSYQGYDMFRHLPNLKMGDEILVTNYWETLRYKVCETKVILPNEFQNVYIQPGRDLITLSTCHPFPGNTHRYLVFAERSMLG